MRNRNEPVRLTRIYTRAGDAGVTGLGDGTRIRKSDPRIEAYGSVDELNASLGLVLAAAPPPEVRVWLEEIQNDLFDLGADLAVPSEDRKRARLRAQPVQVQRLEQLCDQVNEALEPLASFVLPRGNEVAARLHFARTVCRRAERRIVELADQTSINPTIATYLNRLSDLLFIVARAAGRDAGDAVSRPGGTWADG
jgi:cob(I)alamin adenosyltransferase